MKTLGFVIALVFVACSSSSSSSSSASDADAGDASTAPPPPPVPCVAPPPCGPNQCYEDGFDGTEIDVLGWNVDATGGGTVAIENGRAVLRAKRNQTILVARSSLGILAYDFHFTIAASGPATNAFVITHSATANVTPAIHLKTEPGQISLCAFTATEACEPPIAIDLSTPHRILLHVAPAGDDTTATLTVDCTSTATTKVTGLKGPYVNTLAASLGDVDGTAEVSFDDVDDH